MNQFIEKVYMYYHYAIAHRVASNMANSGTEEVKIFRKN